jgi:hypothetical protein
MRPRAPSQVNMMQLYRPPCPKCGCLTALTGIEPAPEPGHDLRRFECIICSHVEVVKIKFK